MKTAGDLLPMFVKMKDYPRHTPLPSDVMSYNHIVAPVRIQVRRRKRLPECNKVPSKLREALSDIMTPCTGFSWEPMTQDKQKMHPLRDVEDPSDRIYLDFNLNQDNVKKYYNASDPNANNLPSIHVKMLQDQV